MHQGDVGRPPRGNIESASTFVKGHILHRGDAFTAAALTGTLTLVPTAATAAHIVGTIGDDTLRGTSSHDRMNSRRGDDNLAGRSGRDRMLAGRGENQRRDLVDCGPGRDTVSVEKGQNNDMTHGHWRTGPQGRSPTGSARSQAPAADLRPHVAPRHRAGGALRLGGGSRPWIRCCSCRADRSTGGARSSVDGGSPSRLLPSTG